ncbi:efflux RND transporter permease subunit [Thermodesulfovibrio sp. Kuro-1]|uniref:efflux RND transporter permease subunit n=1 Tax=Thermodesulfovibrio sp. Kuro-1 TaxID=2580394 RepID=UPI001143D03A|nr:efflux RND transporter permease subunit [Thermodesulfovibrio sp. Kuro-1]
MLSKFFLDRPVFAWVIAIAIMGAGCLAIYNLPIAQYPSLAPPSIYIQATYPGASAETVENSVTQIIEEKMTGLDRLLYMSAVSDSSGSCRIELTFEPGTDPDLAWAKVQNKLQLAMPSLPEAVQKTGISVGKATRNYLLIVSLISEDGRLDAYDLRDYLKSNVEKVLARIEGVGEVETFGFPYAMRIWIEPHKLVSYGLTISDVVSAIKAYNVEVSGGQLGGAPAKEGQRLNAPIIVQSMLKEPDEFAAIPVRINPDGSSVKIKDVARVELGTDYYDIEAFYNGKPAAALAVRPLPGANALDVADKVKKKIDELSRNFPAGVKVVYPYDTTPFTKVAINEVVKTLIEAIVLVFLIMWLFLGSLRATLIPTITVPVVLLGTFAVLGLAGYSINMLTMFAMVLAIGLLVDDAIVVVENVERIMREEKLPVREAVIKSMDQITSALIGIGVVLSAVFAPMAFFKGSTGIIYRQFAITIISAMLLSVFVALTLAPVLCVTFLRPHSEKQRERKNIFYYFNLVYEKFYSFFFKSRFVYTKVVENSFRKVPVYIFVYIIIVVVLGLILMKLPTAYLPEEDQGIMLAQVILPSGSTLEQTEEVLSEVKDYFLQKEKDAVDSIMTARGISFSGRAQSVGIAFIKLKDWHLRDSSALRVKALQARAMMHFSQNKKAMIFVFPPPSIIELGNATGFDLQLMDMGGLGHQKLMEARNQFLYLANQDRRLKNVRPNGMDDIPEYKVDIDWQKAGALGVPITSINNTISAAFGSSYVNDFIKGGRVKRVYVQADTPYRMLPEDMNRLYVRNNDGKMVPFSSFASGRWIYGSPRLERYNGFPSMNIWGEPATGTSSGEAMKAVEEIVSKLPKGVGYAWTGSSYQERLATGQAPILYAFSVFVIFLCLAALYESWTIPITNLILLPLGIFGSALATWLMGLHNDVYFQIGFLVTMGLSSKNAILIIQFARDRIKQGEEFQRATVEAATIRYRPVIMTSLALFFGILPLAIARGAGSGAMNAIGVAIEGGVLAGTFISIVFVPLFFVLILKFFKVRTVK